MTNNAWETETQPTITNRAFIKQRRFTGVVKDPKTKREVKKRAKTKHEVKKSEKEARGCVGPDDETRG